MIEITFNWIGLQPTTAQKNIEKIKTEYFFMIT